MRIIGYDDFFALRKLACAAAIAEYGYHWAIKPGVSVMVRVPAKWTSCKVFGRTSKSPRDMRLPVARYWPTGELPNGMEHEPLPSTVQRTDAYEIAVLIRFGLAPSPVTPVRRRFLTNAEIAARQAA